MTAYRVMPRSSAAGEGMVCLRVLKRHSDKMALAVIGLYVELQVAVYKLPSRDHHNEWMCLTRVKTSPHELF